MSKIRAHKNIMGVKWQLRHVGNKSSINIDVNHGSTQKKKTMTADFDSNIETGELLMVAHA